MPSDNTKSNAADIASVLSLSMDDSLDWKDGEYAAILSHQLKAGLTFDLPASLHDVTGEEVLSLTSAGENPVDTFGDLITSKCPPIGLLRLAKDFFKSSPKHPRRPLPIDVAQVLYYAVIIAARMRCSESLTTADDVALVKGLRWALSRKWLPAEEDLIRPLLQQGLDAIQPPK